tara:strand:+ start:52282 stop:52467 length:186 start_codon:yes stop_codon:yes gene_type:complete
MIKTYLKDKYEMFLFSIARKLLDRNVQRSSCISRRDNNYLFEVQHKLEEIEERMKTKYENI